MNKRDLRIVYMGTPEFAVTSLKRLVEGGYNVVGVITAPDRPAGRGQKVRPSAVKEYAVSQNLPLLQPVKLQDPDFLTQLKSWNADLQIVVAFRMLPEVVWDMPRLGTFNLHASLLPQYRGAAPIHWAVINGEIETGVTTFFLDHKIDTGKIILQKKVAIKEADNVGVIHDKLMELGGELVVETVDALLNNNIQPIPQEKLIEGELKNAPKLFRENCKIDWTQSVETIYNFIRGLSPYPSAWSPMFVASENKAIDVKVFASEKIIQKHNLDTGTIQTDGKEYIQVAVRDGFIVIKELQLPGKKRLKVDELLRGYEITNDFYMLTNKKK
ncbi:MAG: methionyl-tRNA formyltransferase [Bacteroides sp.]|nr:methionyl-tRNA formyltransferase [Bacteroides sp.]MDD2644886.1 methionyl-tRNA formyltransferase [Bacteroides sp.]MDD4054592.1 methionyl-tRNA formyltransferase [Bacteroides sp.]MDD4719912.1 methionyl-tRNA formyltransferase [Bacteroides sp.]NLI64830.1 methionyl-tRNA formyltransferase [Bacteroidales bacterium]